MTLAFRNAAVSLPGLASAAPPLLQRRKRTGLSIVLMQADWEPWLVILVLGRPLLPLSSPLEPGACIPSQRAAHQL